MSVLKDVLLELRKMFLADARLSLAVLALALGIAAMARAGVAEAICQALLVLGAIAVLVASVRAAARRR
ncbi:MAG: hypothetical protein H6895_06835 [Defluviimonas sp.]|uniref:hypothetical protein n=1 Tax=Albidovulum sp. TaxID=1872424 RepID=UPI001D49A8AD|nr:hypothetical protein [Paracoccaceae bacterium]MCC0063787.1 hypothetical protein [Defluviimonas sp.]